MENIGYVDEIFSSTDSAVVNSNDFIIALFVVVFDTKKGNCIEWCIPNDIDLTGVEFKAIVSGSHTVTEDFVYFRHQEHYGLSCFALKSVNNAEERGARMKSVGIICTKYTSLHEHQDFLELQVKYVLEKQYQYHDLISYYFTYRNCPNRNNAFIEKKDTDDEIKYKKHFSVLKIRHPVGCFSQFIAYFGVSIFVLWKFLLLKKRILLFAPPPVGTQCYRAYCLGLLANHGYDLHRNFVNNLFYVNVGNLLALQNMDSFIACTTESILYNKQEAYDLYVNKQSIECPSQRLKHVTKINSADYDRYSRLCKYSEEQLSSGLEVTDDEIMYIRFFIEQNNRIFKVLYDVASQEDKLITSNHMKEMGLDPRSDRVFVSELAELYDIKLQMYNRACCGS
ncbi:DENN domain-containing protein 11 isoform X3 [Hydra vulgaris]|uniref:DENN domain-containing protein 11 isoform X3 n=1 Tax=Hydra vulgaris TaxID=6087 RepID=A0ABM4DPS5_HYDVU